MIELINISKDFGPVTVLKDISFKVTPSEIVGFLGPNGAGKTTTMRIITGYISPTKGQVLINNLTVEKNPLQIKRILGYLPEQNPLYTDMLVSEYLHFIAALRKIPSPDHKSAITRVAAICGIKEVINKSVSVLSKGYRQRLGLAQTLIHNPDILILDEPTAGLDPNQIVEIRNLIKEIGKTKTIVISTHILPEAAALCNRVIIINQGTIVAEGSLEELQKKSSGMHTLSIKIGREGSLSKDKLGQLKGVTVIKELKDSKGITRYQVNSQEDIRTEIFKLAVNCQAELLELHEEQASLEDTFHNLTTKES